MKSVVALAMVGSAAAFNAPMMSMGRREVVQAGAASAAVAPFLAPQAASARYPRKEPVTVKDYEVMMAEGKAPAITIFDHRGCSRAPKEGNTESGTQDDEMLVKVVMRRPKYSEAEAAKKLAEFIGMKEKGLDGDVVSNRAS
uniref:Phycoerythrin alpha-subunit 1 n=1 Tax=Proteomonas sulcata TaxID=77928 RepID=A0A067YTA4_9CRYP|nr:phycoerythrin alpha-subunit 1 [Proteomonas sulcata]